MSSSSESTPPLSPRTLDTPPITSPLFETTTPSEESDEQSDGGEILKARDITAEDAQSMFQPAISRQATHLTSPKTPAAEKAAAFEDRPSGYFDEESVLNPLPEVITPPIRDDGRASGETEGRGRTLQVPESPTQDLSSPSGSASQPPSPELRPPSPWRSTTVKNSVGQLSESRSVLQEAFGPLKRRSLSGSGDAIKKFLPKGLPSLPKPSSFIPSAPSFFSSSQSKGPMQGSGANSRVISPTMNNSSSTIVSPRQDENRERPSLMRRTTSHESSLLYHTPSRSSSLGDDSRWVNVSQDLSLVPANPIAQRIASNQL